MSEALTPKEFVRDLMKRIEARRTFGGHPLWLSIADGKLEPGADAGVRRPVLPAGARVPARDQRDARQLSVPEGTHRARGEHLRGGDGTDLRLQSAAPGSLHSLRRSRSVSRARRWSTASRCRRHAR